MASVRKLKKELNYLTFELVNECLVYKHFHPEAEQETVDGVIKSILGRRNELVARINNPDGKDNRKLVKKYYNTIINDADNLVDLMDKIQ